VTEHLTHAWVKVKLSLCLTANYAMKMYGGEMHVWVHVFFTTALVGGEWSASRPPPFYPRVRALPPRYPAIPTALQRLLTHA
jgi:hypothetical protein